MASSSIVRLGPNDNNLSAQLLRKSIISFFQKSNCDGNHDVVECSTNDDNRQSDSRFIIRNKYFNANIVLKDIENQEKESETKVMEDGIILVFDAVQSNPDRHSEISDRTTVGGMGNGATFDSLQFAHEKSVSNDACGELLRLCVGVSLTELSPSEIRGKDHEKEYSRRILWCLDNGYEYIEADLSDEGKLKGHDSRDKDGFARIVEAIEGTVWSSASMSISKSNKLKDSLADSKAKIQESKSKNSVVVAGNEESKEYNPPDSLELTQELKTKATVEAPKDVSKRICDNLNDTGNLAAIFGLNEGTSGTDPEDLDADKLFVQMESVLKEASQIREASKNGILSDEERRERAGDAALALVNLMGQFGLDDDDSSEDYCSDDSGIVESG